jgi:hypothetical protein
MESGEPGGLTSSWDLVANNAVPGGSGTVTGSVLLYPPGWPACPEINWSVSGTYSPSAITSGASAASTSFTWVASNPSPSAECDGYVPVATVTYTGQAVNATNGTATGTTTNNEHVNGTFSIFTDISNRPQGETIDSKDFGIGQASTQLIISEAVEDTPDQDDIDPDDTLFQGRQVFESMEQNVPATDGCWQASGGTAPFGSYAVEGSVFNVGPSQLDGTNVYQDNVGWTLTDVQWYKDNLPAASLPCTAQFGQTMNILSPNPLNPTSGQVVYYTYATHSITVTIGSSTVTVTKDGTSASTSY